MSSAAVSTRIYPAGMLYTLSRQEVERLHDVSRGDLSELVRRCALAVLNTGIESDDAEALLASFEDLPSPTPAWRSWVKWTSLGLCLAAAGTGGQKDFGGGRRRRQRAGRRDQEDQACDKQHKPAMAMAIGGRHHV